MDGICFYLELLAFGFMAKKKKKKKKQKQSSHLHPEAKGLIVFALTLFLSLSLISFHHSQPSENWLGILGYVVAFVFEYLFGLSSYLMVLYFLWISYKLFKDQKVKGLNLRISYFSTFIFCICMLLNVGAELFEEKASILQNIVYTETATFYEPHPVIHYRYNLGGVPFYYLYIDFPIFNLQKLLSDFGVAIIFSMGAVVSFVLLSQTSVRNKLHLLKEAVAKLFFFLAKITLVFKRRKPAYEPRVKPTKPVFIAKPKPFEPVEKEPKQSISSEPIIHTLEEKIPVQPIIKPIKETTGSSNSAFLEFQLPSPNLLTDAQKVDQPNLKKGLKKQAKLLEDTLYSFGIEANVGEIHCGPTITSFEVQPPVGVKVQKIKALEKDIALNLEAKSIRIIAPIPGKAAVGVEIPAMHPQEVSFKEMLLQYQTQKKMHIPLLLGKTVSGENVIADLAKMPHCLIAGATGSGKSVCINTLVMSILMNAKPDEVKLLMIDPKKVELTQYSNLPHMIAPVISEAHGAYAALQWLVSEMGARYEILKKIGLRNIASFNSRKRKKDEDPEIPEKLPYIVCIMDEFADLMMVSSSDLETPIARIAQMARAVGIHMVLATQRPSREVITGIIKANIPTRIAFKVASRINSQIILDETGAETLLGNGDLLFLPPGSSQLVRAQGAYIRDQDINQCVEAICEQAPPDYLIKSFDAMKKEDVLGEEAAPKDELYDAALEIVVQTKTASTTYLQRKLKIGYARAASLMDELESNGVVSAPEGSKQRRVLLDPSDLP